MRLARNVVCFLNKLRDGRRDGLIDRSIVVHMYITYGVHMCPTNELVVFDVVWLRYWNIDEWAWAVG